MLFGQQKQRGLFGGQMPQMPMGGAQYNLATNPMQAAPNENIQAALSAMPRMTPQAEPPQTTGQGMFGAKKPGINWMGVLADTLAGAAGKEGPYMASMMAQQQQERLAQHAAAQRQASMEDHATNRRFDIANPMPSTAGPHYWESNDGSLMQVGRDGKPAKLYADPTPKYNWIPDGNGGGKYEAIPGTGSAPAFTPPNAPVGKLTPIGGPTPRASAGFPVNANGFVPPPTLAGGHMTSGRRTVEGNRAVGGVENSPHLSGASADYAGPDLQAILEQARKFPGIKRAFIHDAGSGKHVHTEGEGWNTPYYGKNGTRGR